MNEFETFADIDGERGMVTVCYELDGYKPIGMWVSNEFGVDITLAMDETEYDKLYEEACQDAAESMACAAESYCEGER